MKNVLLVEPRKHKIALASLMKFSTYFKQQGYTVWYVNGIQYFGLPKEIDKLLVSSVFTFDLKEVVACTNHYKDLYQLEGKDVYVGGIAASLMPDYVSEKCGEVNLHIGVCNKVDQLPLDYGLYPKIDYSIVWTTRGCIRKCPFCMVPVLEGKIRYIEDWEKQINHYKPKIQMIDNNFTAAKKDWIEYVCDRLKYFNKLVDINQSVDCRIFNEFHAEQFSKVRLECLRFSYDTDKTDEDKVRKAVEIAKEYGFTDIRFDVLYNFEDTPQNFYHRLDVINELDCKAFPMKYIPLDSFTREFIGKEWNKNQLIGFNKLMGIGFSNGMIGNGTGTRKTFKNTFGNDEEEFVKKLNSFAVDKKGEILKGQFTFDKFR